MRSIKIGVVGMFLVGVLTTLQGCSLEEAIKALLVYLALSLAVGGGDDQSIVPTRSVQTSPYDAGNPDSVCTTTAGGQSITFGVYSQLAVKDWDIILGTIDDVKQYAISLGGQTTCSDVIPTQSIQEVILNPVAHAIPQGTVIDPNSCAPIQCPDLWTNSINEAEIPYVIGKNFWGVNDAVMETRIKNQMKHWEDNVPTIHFIEKKYFHDSYVLFLSKGDDTRCWSFVGNRKNVGRQEVNLGFGCPNKAIIHELGHVIGLYHEQNRSDRNEHVTIRFDNMRPCKLENGKNFCVDTQFQRNLQAEVSGDYDFDSIMHYGPTAGGKLECGPNKNEACITIELPPGKMTGVTEVVSPGDIAAALRLYPGTANQPPAVQITSPSNGASFTQGTSVTFTGTASDPEEGIISNSISWSSSLDGTLGTNTSSFATSTLSVGTHTITANVMDSNGVPAQTSIQITVTNPLPQNNAPVCNNFSLSVTENSFTENDMTILNRCSDVDSDPLMVSFVSNPTHGTTTKTGPNIRYTPNPNYTGPDSYQFRVTDGTAESNTATVSLTVNPAAPPNSPTANANGPYTCTQGSTVTLSSTGSSPPSGGSITQFAWDLDNNGSFETPGQSPVFTCSSVRTFTVTLQVTDNNSGTDTAQATVNVTAPAFSNPQITSFDLNNQSTAQLGDTITFRYGINNPNSTSVAITLGAQISLDGISWTDDPTHDVLLTLASGSNPNKSRLFTIPTSISTGLYDARWVVFEQGNPGNVYDTQTVANALTVTSGITNNAPICGGFTTTTSQNTPVDINITSGCSDPNGDSMTISFVGVPINGTVQALNTTTIRFTPTNGFSGTSLFQLRVKNSGGLESNLAQWTVNINASTSSTPILQVSTTSLSFSTQQGSNPSSQTFNILNGNGGILSWSISKNISWLTVSDTSGLNNRTITVSVNSSGLSPGNYSGNITITASGAQGSPKTIAVTLAVTSLPPQNPTLSINNSTSASGKRGASTFNFSGSHYTPFGSVRQNFVHLASGISRSGTIISTSQGNISWSFSPGCNDPLGLWTVSATDLSTNKTSSTVNETILFNSGDGCNQLLVDGTLSMTATQGHMFVFTGTGFRLGANMIQHIVHSGGTEVLGNVTVLSNGTFTWSFDSCNSPLFGTWTVRVEDSLTHEFSNSVLEIITAGGSCP